MIAMTPTVLCLWAGFNPSSWEVAGAFAGIVGLLLLVSDPNHRASRWWLVTATFGLTCMASMRVASFAWLIIIIGFAGMIAGSRVRQLVARRDVRVAMAVVAASTVWGLVWQSLAGTREVATPNDHSLLDGLVASFASSSVWYGQQIGYLGWLDVPPSTFTVWVTITAVGVLLVGAWAMSRKTQSWLLALALLAAIGVPIMMSALVFQSVGMIWQGRYNLPIIDLTGALCGSCLGLQ